MILYCTKRCKIRHCKFPIMNRNKGFQQIAINHSYDIDLKDFMELYEKCNKTYLVFGIDTTLSSGH